MAAAANALSGDSLRSFFARGAIEQRIRPLLAMEQFTAAGCERALVRACACGGPTFAREELHGRA